MRRPLLAAALAAVFTTSCGGPLLSSEMDFPDISVEVPTVGFLTTTGVLPSLWCSPSGLGNPPCITKDFQYDLGSKIPLLTDKNATADLRLLSLKIVLDAQQPAGVTVTDLGTVQSVTLKLLDPADTTHEIVVATYVKTEAAPTTIVTNGEENTDFGPYLRSGQFTIRAELTYETDVEPFQADVSADFALVVKYNYGALL